MSVLHTSMPDLPPVNPAVGVYPAMCRSQPTVMILAEKKLTFSGVSESESSRRGSVASRTRAHADDWQDSFTIKDSSSGAELLQCHGKAMSIHDRKSEQPESGIPVG